MTNRRDFLRTSAAFGACAVLQLADLLAPRKKKILILGGTGFLGPHDVRAALARGHEVTVFNRGRSGKGMFGKDVEELVGDRADDLEALKGRTWDAVIDESASRSDASSPSTARTSRTTSWAVACPSCSPTGSAGAGRRGATRSRTSRIATASCRGTIAGSIAPGHHPRSRRCASRIR